MTLYRKSLFKSIALLSTLGISLILSACGGGESPVISILQPDVPKQPELSRAEQLAANGNYLAAAQAWREQASKETSPLKEGSLLKAADMLLLAHAHDDAHQLLNEIVIVNASVEQQIELQFLKTRLALGERRPNDAFAELDILRTLPITDNDRVTALALRADIFTQTGHHYEAARQRIQLDALLDFSEQESNHNRIWESLNLLGPIALDTFRQTETSPTTSGWLDLAWLVKAAGQSGDRLTLALNDWQTRFPQHPAATYILPTLKTLDDIPRDTPRNIALLLPLEGRFSNAARAVRDGFLSAYYTGQEENKVNLRIYSADRDNVSAVYDEAVRNGANIVVGPLDKDALLSLLTRQEFSVPVLVLNDIPGAELPANVYSFSLTPEDEARQVAEHIWLDGHSRGIALYPEGHWGERVYDAFRQRWLELGGELVEASTYVAEGRDFASPIRGLLNVDESHQRHKALQRLLKENVKFQMRRRQDIDFVFLAAYPKQARQVRPQFDFFNASALPIYATSHVYSGMANAKADRDMNGIIFGDMPWTLGKEDISTLRSAVERNWGNERMVYARLFAFGADAWQLIPNLERLSRYRFARLAGGTGSLRIDENNRVHRGLSWATFRAGTPRLIQPPILSPDTPASTDAPSPIPVGFPPAG